MAKIGRRVSQQPLVTSLFDVAKPPMNPKGNWGTFWLDGATKYKVKKYKGRKAASCSLGMEVNGVNLLLGNNNNKKWFGRRLCKLHTLTNQSSFSLAFFII